MKQYIKKELEQYINSVSRETKKVTRTKKGNYYELICSFDIETTSTYTTNKEKFAFMYEWTFGIENYICYGRTWDSFLELIEVLIEKLKLSKNKRLAVYVHNLSFEFQFICKLFCWESVFALEERKPIKALTTKGIEFRCSYVLSGLNLALTAKNLTSHKMEKLVGDLDYKLVRHSNTPLTEQELKYCEYDVKIVIAYIKEQLEEYQSITKLPMTNTGRVRSYVRNNCLYTSSNHHKTSYGRYSRYRKLMTELTLDECTYKQLKQTFQGGFTHANYRYVGKILQDVHSIDFTSSYPTVMLAEYFPMSKPIKVTNIKQEKLLENFNNPHKGYMMYLHFTNIRSVVNEMYISEHKCIELKNPIVNNGRIFQAEKVVYPATDIDFKILQKCYVWEKLQISNVYEFYMDFLPLPIIKSIIKLYQDKTTLKGVEGQENEYLKSKGMLNSVYGMCVTDIVKDESTYTDEWGTSKADTSEQIQKYNESKNRFLYYPWGVWVTAYARKNLWNGILNIGNDYIYSDTDSIKFVNYEKHKKYIDWYNNNITKKLYTMCDFYKLDKSSIEPMTIKGKKKPLGVWDYEGKYKYFKTLGAKRYMYYDDSLHITIAGLSKKQGTNYLLEKNNHDIQKVFENFNDSMYIPASKTGKNTHTYIDDEREMIVKDYTGKLLHVKSLSSIHLEECDFTLELSKQYISFLAGFMNGYKETGVKYE